MVDAPRRIQLSRAKGWRMPEDTVKVDRTTKWGNPFTLATLRAEGIGGTPVLLLAECVGRFRAALSFNLPISVGDAQRELRGKNLACWCRLCEAHRDGKPFGVVCPHCAPCHSDPLGEIANAADGEGFGSPRPTLNADEGPGTNPQPDKSREGT